MTKEERDFLEVLTTEVGTSVIISHDKVTVGLPDEMEEPIEIPISHDNLELIRDVKKPLLDKLNEILEEGDFDTADLLILESLQEKLS